MVRLQTSPFVRWFAGLALFCLGALSCSLPARLLTGQVMSAPENTTVAVSPGRIAFVGVDRNIYTILPDGTDRLALTDDADAHQESGRIYQFPTWSPDGARVAFTGLDPSAGAQGEVSLYAANAQGGDLQAVFTSAEYAPFYLYWAPDSRSVTALSSSPGGEDLTLHLIPVDNGEARVLATGQPFYWHWAPDGSRILIHSGGSTRANAAARLALLDPGNAEADQELAYNPTFFQAPAWSPDGKTFVLAAEGDGEQDRLLLLDARGNELLSLTTYTGAIAFGWAPDGERLAYITFEAGAVGPVRRLSVLELGEAPETTEIPAELVIAFFWAPDGKSLAYFVPTLAVPSGPQAQAGQPEPELALQLFRWDLASGLSNEVASFKPTDEFLSVLTFFDQYQHSATIWSPDSRHLVLSALDNTGVPVISIVDAGGAAEPVLLAEGTLAFWSWK